VTFGPLYDREGRLTQIIASGVDVSDRKRVEEDVRTNAQRLRLALDSIDAATFDQDAEPRYTWMYHPQLGYCTADVIGKTDADLLDPAGARAATEIKRQAFESGERARGEVAVTVGGETRYFELIAEQLRNDGGRVVGLAGVSVDITERLKMQQALRESEALLGQAQQMGRIGSWQLDPSSGLLTWSDEVFRIFEIDKEVFGASYEAFLDTIHPDDRDAVDEAYTGSLETREPYQITHRLLLPDGRVKHVHEHCETEYDEAGKPVRSVGTVQDITERKLHEVAITDISIGLDRRVRERTAQLEATNKELETFSYSVSHDLKAPLRSIDGYSRLLLEDYAEKLDDEGRRLLDTIRQATSQMNQLIEDLLAYSRLERRELAVTQLELRALIESVIVERADEVRARGVTVNVTVADGPVTADRDGLTMALRNLLENALKFLGDTADPTIEFFACHETDAACVLSVRDNGIGFDMRYHDRIFGIFQRLHRSEDYPGTGVGLAIVRRAVERMGGRAWAESEPGKGATFYLEIPR
jgi:PAS domain S-box-containing protein